ncbi:MAG: tetratricopeptide repeat protein [Dehalococcoidia bacterium]|nr:tetratricopeptide repeat protein [Dehalococcoidia bacterium]MSQ16773.1 tetratricopeptide repeat protein [Dehalococcoidia bacterium]
MSSRGEQRDFRELLAQELRLPEAQLGLDRAALYLAGDACPSLDPQQYLAQLDALATQVREMAGPAAEPEALARALHHLLFDTLGFSGNPSDYYNPDNSYLHRVLDTKVGIPIALSVLYLELARRLGVACQGVGLPGHFLVNVTPLGLYLDPFHGGQLLSAGDCRRLLGDMFGPSLPWQDEFLAPYAKRDIIFRMLNNLKQIFLGRQDYPRAASTLEQMTLANPGAPSPYKELGWCRLRMEQPRLALECLQRYLQLDPAAGDAGLIRRQVQALQAALGQGN